MGIWDDADDVYLCSKQKRSAGRGIFFSMIRCTRHILLALFLFGPKATFRRDNSSSVYTSARGLGNRKSYKSATYVARGSIVY